MTKHIILIPVHPVIITRIEARTRFKVIHIISIDNHELVRSD